MRRLGLAVAGLGFVLLTSGVLLGQDKKGDDKDSPPVTVIRGNLPQHFKRLGLSDSQKNQMLRVLAKYHGKIGEMEQKIKELKAEEKEEMEKLLTDSQRTRLRELRSGEGSTTREKSKTEEKKEDK
jgi:hypothetical protein